MRCGNHASDDARRGLGRIALVVWAVVVCAVCVRVTVQQKRHPHSTLDVYYKAGMHWRQRAHLYRHPDDYTRAGPVAPMLLKPGRDNIAWGGFRYCPTMAILFVPVTWMPRPVGEVVWRVFLAAVSLGALGWCCRVGIPRLLARKDWPVLLLLVVPAFTGCLNNGQSSCIVIACMLAGIAAAATDRWTACAACLTLATVLKLYPVSLALLLAVLYPRRFPWRYLPMLALAFALPFLLRPGAWVIEEHRRWVWHLFNDAIQPDVVLEWDHDLRLVLLKLTGVKLSPLAFKAVQLAAAAAIGALCVGGRLAGWPRRRLLARMLGLCACWMTVMGEATEPSTYVLVAPSLAWALWESWLRPAATPRRVAARAVLLGSYLLFLSAYVVLWFRWGKLVNNFGLEPMGGLLLFGYLLVECVRDLKLPAGRREGFRAPAAPA